MYNFKEKYDINDLLEITTILRGKNGCPWDMEQSHKSIRMNVLEEAYEVMEAIDSEDKELLKEELGDLLFQAVFHAELERENESFDFGDVCDGICKKLIYRHPHVFGTVEVSGTGDVLKNWDSLKSKAKGEQTATERLKSVPKLIPALMRAQKVGKRAANVGMDFASTEDALKSVKDELKELETALASEKDEDISEEYGDLLFSCCNLGRFIKRDSEEMLGYATDKFIRRFAKVETLAAEQGKKLDEMSAEELDVLWQKAKSL